MIIGRDILGDYDLGTNREYLITNGNGSFSSGSINGNLARSYHGILIKSFDIPLDRKMTLHKIEENFDGINLTTSKRIDGDKVTIQEGYKYIQSFQVNPFPKWIFSVNGSLLEKEMFMPYEKDIVVIKYKLLLSAKKDLKLKANLLFNYRYSDHIIPFRDYNYHTYRQDNHLEVMFDNHKMYIYTNGDIKKSEYREDSEDFYGNKTEGIIRRNIAYDIELNERGNYNLDSSYEIANNEIILSEGDTFYIVASFEKLENLDIEKIYNDELNRVNNLKDLASKDDEIIRDIAYSCDQFIVNKPSINGKTVIAGYPWFGDWGRDTMIALPGLTLSTGRFEDAKKILLAFAKYCDKGMLPNLFPNKEGDELQYNTIDAAMWYFYAVYKYLEYTNDYEFIKNDIYPTLKEIIYYYKSGTRYNIHMTETGMISGGSKEHNLTWMDVKYKGWAVTPRYGMAVEISALWYNALKLMESLSEKYGENSSEYKELASLVKNNFEKIFWNEEKKCLYDYVCEDGKNDDIRPNQIFVVSLPYSLLSKDKEKQIVDTVLEKLYTSKGLKSLSSDNPEFKGFYFGNLYERDSKYHQGTVWGWPIGHFVDAYNKIYGDKEKNRLLLNGLIEHFYSEGCVNSVSEIFDGDVPHSARGCFAQAWSVSELLRVLKELC